MPEEMYIYWYSNEEFSGESSFLAKEQLQEYYSNQLEGEE